MSAAALLRASRPRSSTVRASQTGTYLLAAVAGLCLSASAEAEVGATVSVFSEARFRGYSLSAGRPVASLDLSYDDPGGLYGGLSATAVIGGEDSVRPLGLVLNGGYAKRLSSGLVVDAGVVHAAYAKYAAKASGSSYTELYAGVTHKFLSSRITFAPHYFEHGASTLYGEVDANVTPVRKLHLNGHFGALFPISYRDESESPDVQYDWRVGAAREFGGMSLHLIWSGGGPGKDFYRGRYHDRNALMVGLSCPL